MSYRIIVTAEAEAQLDSLYEYIAGEASIAVATRYLDSLIERIAKLTDFPNRGTPRDDLRPDLRTVPFRGRVTIAYQVVSDEVRIAGIFSAGQNWESLLREE